MESGLFDALWHNRATVILGEFRYDERRCIYIAIVFQIRANRVSFYW